ncbi:MAG: hypothetical protein M1281_15570 [Chloroflexi bacterium]|nr:hypothetical protein [Chloroflexota bacterium]
MSMGKNEITCADAIRSSLKHGEVVSFTTLLDRVRRLGDWQDDTIFQHLIHCIVNLPPARKYWKNSKPFLLIRLDGQYELYDPSKHPRIID